MPSWTVSAISHAEQSWGSEALSPSCFHFCNRQNPAYSYGFRRLSPCVPRRHTPTFTVPLPSLRPPFLGRQGHPPCTSRWPGRQAPDQAGVDPWSTAAKASGGLAWACVGSGI